MRARLAFVRLFVIAIGPAVALIGCGGPGSVRALPLGAHQIGATTSGDQEASLETAVLRSHAAAAGSGGYGIINGAWQTPPSAKDRPGYYLIDGEVVPGPPEDAPPTAQTATLNCTTFTGNVPPPCTDTGEFRRVYSAPGYSYALAHVTLPANNPAMPKGSEPLDGDTGFIYMEGWTVGAPNAGNSEFGFQYSATNNWYTPYYRTNNPKGFGFATYSPDDYVHYAPGSMVTFALAGYTIGRTSYLHASVLGTTKGTGTCTVVGGTALTHLCLAHGHFEDSTWTPSSCCIMARMTTIGQTNKNDAFYDGAAFGPVTWSGVELATTAPTPAPSSTLLPIAGGQPAWASAGTQNWPPAQAKIVTAGVSGSGETDTIDLAPLPSVTLTMNPSTEQIVHPPTTLKYSMKMSGATSQEKKAFGLEYAWRLGNPESVPGDSLSVPGATTFGKFLVGPSSAATLTIGPRQGPYELHMFGDIFFTDAAGKVGLLDPSLEANDIIDVRLKQ